MSVHEIHVEFWYHSKTRTLTMAFCIKYDQSVTGENSWSCFYITLPGTCNKMDLLQVLLELTAPNCIRAYRGFYSFLPRDYSIGDSQRSKQGAFFPPGVSIGQRGWKHHAHVCSEVRSKSISRWWRRRWTLEVRTEYTALVTGPGSELFTRWVFVRWLPLWHLKDFRHSWVFLPLITSTTKCGCVFENFHLQRAKNEVRLSV